MKADIYQSLAAMNQASEEIVKQVEALRDAGLLEPRFAEIRILAEQQNTADINTSVVHKLTAQELEEATRLQNEQAEKEKQLIKQQG